MPTNSTTDNLNAEEVISAVRGSLNQNQKT